MISETNAPRELGLRASYGPNVNPAGKYAHLIAIQRYQKVCYPDPHRAMEHIAP